MAHGKKYTTHVFEKESAWVAEIHRRMTSKKQVVTKTQDGFASEEEAKTWVEAELKSFLERLSDQSKQRAAEHAEDKKYDMI